MDNQAMGLALKEIREEKGLTQEQLANKLYVSRQNVSRWELGTRTINPNVLANICKILDIPIGEFFIKATDNCNLKEEKKLIRYYEIDDKVENKASNQSDNQDKKSNTKNKTKKSQRDFQVADMYNVMLNLYNEKNNERRKKQKYFRMFLAGIVIIIILIISFIIFSLYNAVSIYKINGGNGSIDIINGMFVITRDNVYFDLGSIHNNTGNQIEELELYYYDNDNKKNLIFKETDFTPSSIILYDFVGYNEYFNYDDLDKILNSLTVDMLMSDETSETIYLKTEKQKFSKLFNKRIESGGTGEKTIIEEYEETDLEKFIKENFKKYDDGYKYIKKEGKREIEYTYLDRTLMIDVTSGDIIESWYFDCIRKDLTYCKSKKLEILKEININRIDEAEGKDRIYIDEFNKYLNQLKSYFA